jgi:2-dehydro-3-deoxygluconokinase
MPTFATLGEASLRLSPPRHERLESARTLDVHVTGAESNAAVVAHRLGCEATWVSRLPDSPLGHRVASELRDHGLEVDVAWGTAGRQGLSFYEQGSDPREDIRIEDRAASTVTNASAGGLPLERATEADAAYATGVAPAISTPMAGAAATFLKNASEAGALAAFGLNYREEFWEPEDARETLTALFPVVDVFVASERDVATVLGREGSPAEVAHGLANEWGFETVALHREHGAAVWQDATAYDYTWPEVDVVDPTGVDDAFAGALIARLLEDVPTAAALRTGMAAAALARTIPGPVATVSEPEVERVVNAIEENNS